MKYLRIRPFRVCIITATSCHFEIWKEQNNLQSKTCIGTFSAIHFGCTTEKGMMWPRRDHLKTYFTELMQLKYKWYCDSGMLWSSMCSLIEILSVLEEKISLNCWQLQHDVPVTEIFELNLCVNFLYFLSNWINLLDISSICNMLRAFERNQSLENSCLMPWRPMV